RPRSGVAGARFRELWPPMIGGALNCGGPGRPTDASDLLTSPDVGNRVGVAFFRPLPSPARGTAGWSQREIIGGHGPRSVCSGWESGPRGSDDATDFDTRVSATTDQDSAFEEVRAVKTTVSMTINGTKYSHDVEPRLLLVHYIRELAGLTGTHVGCDTSQCGACTVH